MTAVSLDAANAMRLREMGIGAGTQLTVSQRGGFGGRVVAVHQQRFALDGATVAAIDVEATPAPQLARQHHVRPRRAHRARLLARGATQ